MPGRIFSRFACFTLSSRGNVSVLKTAMIRMTNNQRAIKAALREILVPHLTLQGYCGTFPEFMRRENNVLHLLSVQFDKYGGGFFLEFAVHGCGDKVTSWGEVVPESKITVAHTPVENRARLQQTGSKISTADQWFRHEAMDARACRELVQRVVGMYPQIDAWLRKQVVGANISAPGS